MPLFPTKNRRAYTYTVITPPIAQPIALDLAKSYLNIRLSDTSKDELILLLINSATAYAEDLMRRILISTTYRTYRDAFPDTNFYPYSAVAPGTFYQSGYGENYYDLGLLIRRSPLQSVVSVSYLVDDITTLVPSSVYYNTVESDYSSILLSTGEAWPTDIDNKMQSVIVDFIVGFGDTDADIPSDIKNALLQIVSALFNNRGDCGLPSGCNCDTLAPLGAKSILRQNRIENL